MMTEALDVMSNLLSELAAAGHDRAAYRRFAVPRLRGSGIARADDRDPGHDPWHPSGGARAAGPGETFNLAVPIDDG